MKNLSKTLLASALVAAGITGLNTAHAVEWSLGGELAVELTDAESSDDLGLAVTTTDLVLTIGETFGDVSVEGFIAYEKGAGSTALSPDGAGITVSGGFGSIYVGDDGTGVLAADATDVLYNNSEAFYADPTTNVIDYGLPLSGPFSLNIFADISAGDSEDIDAIGTYGSYAAGPFTALFGFTSIEEDGAYGILDDILDLAVTYEGGPIAAGFGYQESEVSGNDWEVMSAFLTFTSGKFAITPYYEQVELVGSPDNDVAALNVTYSFTDNFYMFFETASYDDDSSDNSEIGLVLTF
jgi:hypothetical protein